ncbi:MAG: hypothetical protein ACI4WY_04745 [Anaerovoracaceae bacterium]
MLSNSNQIDDTEKKGGWVPVTVRMPDNEEIVEITYTMEHYRTGEPLYYTARAFYTDGKHSTYDSDYAWNDMDLEEYIEEEDAYWIPEGWWESVSFGEEFHAVDASVIAWKPLSEPWRGEECNAEVELINRKLLIDKLKLYLGDCKKTCDHTETYYDKGAVKATEEIIKLVMTEPAACNLKEENSTEEDCTSCQYYERTADQYPCSHCRNCYLSKFKAKLGGRENENHGE